MTSFGQLASGRIEADRSPDHSPDSGPDLGPDATIEVAEHWHRRPSGDIVYERKIGDGPWETPTETLERNVWELGHSDNTIEVSGAGWSYEHTMLDIEILCGHCKKVTRSGVNGHFCCGWASVMYERYFQLNWEGKR